MSHARPLQPAVFLDKDGTVLDDVPFNVDPALMRFAPTAAAALARLAKLGVPLVVVSNQSGVAEGRFQEAELHGVGRQLTSLFQQAGAPLSGFYWCPHARAPEGLCDCRKPAPGLLRAAAQTLGLDLARSWMIGDILDDIEAGRSAGCRTVLIDNGNETEWRSGPLRTPHHRVGSLLEAALRVTEHWEARTWALS